MARTNGKRADIWMPLYISDYLADTLHLSVAEHGAYLLMLMHAWMNGGCLPNDDERLRRIARMDAKEWRESGTELRSYFFATEDGLRHHRMDRELERANANIDQRSKAGKASAEARRLKREAEREGQQGGNENPTDVATHVERALQRNPQRDPQRNGKPPPSPITTKTLSGGIATHGGCASGPEPPAAAAFVDVLAGPGIDAAPDDQRLALWAEQGVTPGELSRAIEAARARRRKERSSQPVNVGLIDALLSDIVAGREGPAPGANGQDHGWWESASGITQEGERLGVHQHTDEPFPYFKVRVFEAAGDGPWVWKARGATTVSGPGPARSH